MRIFLLLLISISAALGYFSIFILSEHEQAIITQFGEPKGDTVKTAGIHFKVPFIQKIRRFEKRVLNWDGNPKMINTKDQKYIMVDTTVRWKIIDPLKFMQTLQDINTARTRMDDILDGETRKIISSNNLAEVVRNTNNIINKNESSKESINNETRIEKIEKGRNALSRLILESAALTLKNMGIELVDIQLKGVSYEDSVEKKVYERMISERRKIVEEIRSIGFGEKAKIEGKISEDMQKIKSEAYKEAQKIHGEAKAKAIDIYGKALKKSPSFFSFIRQLEAYEKSINENTRLIFSTDSKFFKQLGEGVKRRRVRK